MAFCSKCGANIPPESNFCPSCGAAAEPAQAGLGMPPPAAPHREVHTVTPARSGAGCILPALVVLAVAVIGLLLWSQRDGARPIAANEQAAATDSDAAEAAATGEGEAAPAQPAETAQQPDEASAPAEAPEPATLSAAALDSAFNSNPAAAAARYAGPVEVTGVIASMVMPGATPALSMEGRTRLNHMIVNFRPGYRQRLALLSKGQTIGVACDSARLFAGTTVLDGCDLN